MEMNGLQCHRIFQPADRVAAISGSIMGDERTDANAHNWGAGRVWTPGDPYPAPILSSLPVRSRSRGRWDGDGM